MNRAQEYVVNSLELHLFFDRIMKEHAIFLTAGLLPPNANLAREGEQFIRQFEALLSHAINLSDQVVRCCVLDSGELVTEFTDCAERQTQRSTGLFIDRELTSRLSRLKGVEEKNAPAVSPALMRQVRQLNLEAISLTERFIGFKERILCAFTSCNLFTPTYPLLIEHILREARLYHSQLSRLEGTGSCGCQEPRGGEPFWNQIMMEHAQFIAGLLDPTEAQLTAAANEFADEYRKLLETASAAHDRAACRRSSLELTRKFRDFKCTGVEGIENCRIRSMILPLLADHVLREANRYLRLLES